MKTDEVIIKKSKIHGLGVFAKRDFRKGEVVLHWDISHIITKEEMKKMTEKEKRYVSFLNNRYVVMQKPENRINHSCEANTNAKDFCDITIVDIKKGEEITADYSKDLAPGEKLICHCGSNNCRKIIENNN